MIWKVSGGADPLPSREAKSLVTTERLHFAFPWGASFGQEASNVCTLSRNAGEAIQAEMDIHPSKHMKPDWDE